MAAHVRKEEYIGKRQEESFLTGSVVMVSVT